MPNVLVLGGSGYLGLAVSQALLRSGNFTVWGTARSAAKAKVLATNEITPVVGEATDAKFLADAVAASRIDIVIDCTSAYEQAGAILSGVVQAARSRAASLGSAAQASPKLGFIYTSGSWVHGSPGTRISDLTVPGTALAPASPATAVAWRPAHEQAILASRDVLDVAVLRPCAIYGRGSWVWGTWWGPLLAAARGGSADPIQIPADKSARCGTVHVDDLAEAYVAAASKIDGRLGAWPVFDITAETLSVVDIIEAARAALSVTTPVAYAGTSGNAFLEALSLVANSDTSRARSVLGWQPKHRDFIQNIGVIVAAWKVTQEEAK